MILVTMLYGTDPSKPYSLEFVFEDAISANLTTPTAPAEATIQAWLEEDPSEPASSLTLLANACAYPYRKEIWSSHVNVYRLAVTKRSNTEPDVVTQLVGPQPITNVASGLSTTIQDAIPNAVLGFAGYTQTGRMRQFTVGLHGAVWEGLADGQGRPTEWEYVELLALKLAQRGYYKSYVDAPAGGWGQFASVPANVVHRVRRG